MKNVYTYRNTRIGREEFRCLTMLFRNLLVRFMRLKFHIRQTRREKLDNLRNHNNKINREGNVQISNAIEMMIYYMDNLQAQIVANWPSLKNEIFDVAMPDVSVVGGVGELLKIADMATTVNISTAPHGPFGPVIS